MGRFKITCILFIIMVLLMTFTFTRDKKVDEDNIVTESEIASYKEKLLNTYNKYGKELTEKEINKKVQEYKDTQISIAKVNARGMDFKEAFKISLVVSAICCEGFYLYVSLKKMHYGELLGGHFGGDRVTDSTELMKRKMQLDFFDKTRESYINKISKDK